jgi:hypothetical protein
MFNNNVLDNESNDINKDEIVKDSLVFKKSYVRPRFISKEYENNYPSLGSLPIKYENNDVYVRPSSFIGHVQKNRAYQEKYEDKYRENYRDKKEGIKYNTENFVKTRICKSVSIGKVCTYGDKCKFAHSPDELRIQCCSFGDRCRFVKWSEHQMCYINSEQEKKCKYIHSGEENSSYLKRMNIEFNIPSSTTSYEALSLDSEKFKKTYYENRDKEINRLLSDGERETTLNMKLDPIFFDIELEKDFKLEMIN